MPPAKATDSDEDYANDSDMPDVSSDSDEEFQEEFMHRAILGRPRSKIYDSKDYVSEATGRAERSGLDASRLEGTNDGWKAAEGSKRVRKKPAGFVAGAASCFKRGSPGATAAVAGSAPPVAPPVAPPPQSGRSEVRQTARQQHRARHKQRAERRAVAQQQVAASEHETSDELFLEFSWRQRRSIAVAAYSQARHCKFSKTEALKIAAISSRCSWRSVHEWVTKWRKSEGALDVCRWGTNRKVPAYFQDEEIKLKAARWWRSRQPKQGNRVRLTHLTVFCSFR